MAKKITKVSDKLAKTDTSFTVNMYDNGYMIEVGGRDKKDDWATARIMVSELEDLTKIIAEIAEMERS
jgi:hypothetical protein